MADQAQASGSGSGTAASETTPLLAATTTTPEPEPVSETRAADGGDVEQAEQHGQLQPAGSVPVPVPVRDHNLLVGSWVAASAAVLAVAVWIPISILRQGQPYDYNLSWGTVMALNPLAALALAAGLFSVFNLVRLYRRNIPLPGAVSVIVDILAGCFGTVLAVQTIGEFTYENHCYHYNSSPDEYARCVRWRWIFEPFVWVFLIASLVLGVTHIILFIYRYVKAYQARGRIVGPTRGWTFPYGQFTVEFTVKLLRQTDDMTRQSQTQDAQRTVQAQEA